MTHGEKRSDSWQREFLLTSVAGAAFGITYIAAAQPFDTIKTRMQAQLGYEKLTAWSCAKKMLREEGILSFYRGSVAMFAGSVMFRSSQWAAAEAVYTYFEHHPRLTQEIPWTAGTQPRVILGGVAGGVARAIFEGPLEYMKVSRQVVNKWKLREIYTGFWITFGRSVGMMTLFVTFLDCGRRNFPEVYSTPYVGSFAISASSSVLAWAGIWPLERIKNIKQARTVMEGRSAAEMRSYDILKAVVKRDGLVGLYRGFLPGFYRSFFGIGASAAVMAWVQKKLTELGARG